MNAKTAVMNVAERSAAAPPARDGAGEKRQDEGSPIAILGVPFDNITLAQAVHLIDRMVQSGRSHYVATPNLDFLVQARRDVELRRILCEADLVICDGMPLVWASRLLGNPLPERVAGSDLAPLLIQLAAEKQYRLFFLGGAPASAEMAVQKIWRQFENLQIAGYYSPPYRPLLEMDHEEIKRRIRQAKPDMLFVAFGCPKQEKWMTMHYRELGVPVSIGMGGTIDFLAGALARAPGWMQRMGLEWTFRLAQEPRRLAGRYSRDLWAFAGPFFAQWWRLQLRRPRAPSPSAPARGAFQDAQEIGCLEWLTRDQAEYRRALWGDAGGKDCLMDLSQVKFIDSTGVGFLIRLQKKLRESGRQLILIAPSGAVRRALQTMKLGGFFATEPTRERARARLRQTASEHPATLASSADADGAVVWRDELTAANAEEVWTATAAALRAIPQDGALLIDLQRLSFMDSSGLAVMARLKKEGRQRGLRVRFRGARPEVLNVARLAKLDRFLFDAERG